ARELPEPPGSTAALSQPSASARPECSVRSPHLSECASRLTPAPQHSPGFRNRAATSAWSPATPVARKRAAWGAAPTDGQESVARACARARWRRSESPSLTPLRCIIRSATSMNLDAWNVAYGSPSPHENGATNLGCVPAPKTLAPVPSTDPVVSIVPMPVFTWSPNMVPRNCWPVSTTPAGVHMCTVPYVFFRLLVVVPAPRLTQRPRYECPTKPVWPLLEWPRTMVELISPRILHFSPIEQLATRSPTMLVSAPM